ncbi:hypothetical protein E05_37640 [Plautia stali symbiont]|nr:hypothetical protein E05_37640 [Plautia stali symbiont]
MGCRHARRQRGKVVALRSAQLGAILIDARPGNENIAVVLQRLVHQPVETIIAKAAPPLRFWRGGGLDLLAPAGRNRQRGRRLLHFAGAAGQQQRDERRE